MKVFQHLAQSYHRKDLFFAIITQVEMRWISMMQQLYKLSAMSKWEVEAYWPWMTLRKEWQKGGLLDIIKHKYGKRTDVCCLRWFWCYALCQLGRQITSNIKVVTTFRWYLQKCQLWSCVAKGISNGPLINSDGWWRCIAYDARNRQVLPEQARTGAIAGRDEFLVLTTGETATPFLAQFQLEAGKIEMSCGKSANRGFCLS